MLYRVSFIKTDVTQHTQGLKSKWAGWSNCLCECVCICSWGVTVCLLCTSVCFFLLVCSYSVKQGHVGALGYICTCTCVYVVRLRAAVDRLLSPVTARVLFVSCGPLLTQTALLWEASCCDSLWHKHAHIHTHKPYKSWSLVALSLGAVQRGRSRGHLPFTKGESSNMWYLNYVALQSRTCSGDGGVFDGVREAGLLFYSLFLFLCPSMCLSSFLALFVVNIAVTAR